MQRLLCAACVYAWLDMAISDVDLYPMRALVLLVPFSAITDLTLMPCCQHVPLISPGCHPAHHRLPTSAQCVHALPLLFTCIHD